MRKFASTLIKPNVFECDIDRVQTAMPDYYLPSAPGVLIAGPAVLHAIGDFPGAATPSGWTRGASGLSKPRNGGTGTLWVQRCGKFWMVERSPLAAPTDYDDTLVFGFVLMPIWTRTMVSAMRLAEYCDPIPQSPVAGCWVRTFDQP
jgi:hypothetical protein